MPQDYSEAGDFSAVTGKKSHLLQQNRPSHFQKYRHDLESNIKRWFFLALSELIFFNKFLHKIIINVKAVNCL